MNLVSKFTSIALIAATVVVKHMRALRLDGELAFGCPYLILALSPKGRGSGP